MARVSKKKTQKPELNSHQKIGQGLKMVREGKINGFIVKKEKNLLDNNKELASKFKRKKPTKDQILEGRFQDILKEVDDSFAELNSVVTEKHSYTQQCLAKQDAHHQQELIKLNSQNRKLAKYLTVALVFNSLTFVLCLLGLVF